MKRFLGLVLSSLAGLSRDKDKPVWLQAQQQGRRTSKTSKTSKSNKSKTKAKMDSGGGTPEKDNRTVTVTVLPLEAPKVKLGIVNLSVFNYRLVLPRIVLILIPFVGSYLLFVEFILQKYIMWIGMTKCRSIGTSLLCRTGPGSRYLWWLYFEGHFGKLW